MTPYPMNSDLSTMGASDDELLLLIDLDELKEALRACKPFLARKSVMAVLHHIHCTVQPPDPGRGQKQARLQMFVTNLETALQITLPLVACERRPSPASRQDRPGKTVIDEQEGAFLLPEESLDLLLSLKRKQGSGNLLLLTYRAEYCPLDPSVPDDACHDARLSLYWPGQSQPFQQIRPLSPGDYPAIPVLDAPRSTGEKTDDTQEAFQTVFTGQQVQQMLGSVLPAAADESIARPVMSSVCLRVEPQGFSMTASDNCVLARSHSSLEGKVSPQRLSKHRQHMGQSFLLPVQSVKHLVPLLPVLASSLVQVHISDRQGLAQVQFQHIGQGHSLGAGTKKGTGMMPVATYPLTFWCRLIQGTYPDADRVIEQIGMPRWRVVLRTEALKTMIQEGKVVIKQRPGLATFLFPSQPEPLKFILEGDEEKRYTPVLEQGQVVTVQRLGEDRDRNQSSEQWHGEQFGIILNMHHLSRLLPDPRKEPFVTFFFSWSNRPYVLVPGVQNVQTDPLCHWTSRLEASTFSVLMPMIPPTKSESERRLKPYYQPDEERLIALRPQ